MEEKTESGRGSETAQLGEAEASVPHPQAHPPLIPPGVGVLWRLRVQFLSHLQGERAVARRLHWVTILRSRELRMMDLELTRWKHVGLFYKQPKSSSQTPFLNSAFSISTAGLLGCWAVLGEGQKGH